jgi:hypothetical protein
MDYESDFLFRAFQLIRFGAETHRANGEVHPDRCIQIDDDVMLAALDSLADFEGRLRANILVDAFEVFLRVRTAEGNSRARYCLETFYDKAKEQAPADARSPLVESDNPMALKYCCGNSVGHSAPNPAETEKAHQ